MIQKDIGQYEILEKIGHGGMGVVYKAIHKKIEKIVAIKALSPQLSEDPKMRDRFINEAKLQAKLSHPNIVNILNYVEQDSNIFLVMEYVAGETLESKLKREGAIAYLEAVEIAGDILKALSYLHSKGVIHRDLKPSNIMFSENGVVKLTDFGISKLIGKKGVTTTALAGSYIYMSPEEIKGEGTTFLSDIYSFGIMLYQMVTGRVPYYYESQFKLMKAHLEEKPLEPLKVNNIIPKKLNKIILKSISKNPDARYKTPLELKQDIEEAVRKKSVIDSLYDKMSEKKSVALSLGVLLIFFIVSIIVFNNTQVTTASIKNVKTYVEAESSQNYELLNKEEKLDKQSLVSTADVEQEKDIKSKEEILKEIEYSKKVSKAPEEKKFTKKDPVRPKPVVRSESNKVTGVLIKESEPKPQEVAEIKNIQEEKTTIRKEWKIRK